MRVAFVSARTAHHEATDATERLRRLTSLLAERGHEITVCCAQWWDGDHDEFEHDDITYRAVASSPSDRAISLRLPNAIRRINPDVVHAASDPPGQVLGAQVGALLARAPLLVEWYDRPTPSSTLQRYAYSYAANAPGMIVAPSRTVKTTIREYGAPDDGVQVVPTGIGMDDIRDLDPDTSGGDIVFSRRLDEDANLETLFLALAEFREYDWRATIVGDGPERESYERQAADLRIDDRVDFVGEKSTEERIALFKNAHVYVHTAEYTPFAVDLLRALACGCVGIVEYHANSSAHELVEHEPRGFLATNAQEVVEGLIAAGNLERLDVNEEFATYDEREFLESYLDRYRDLQSDSGVL